MSTPEPHSMPAEAANRHTTPMPVVGHAHRPTQPLRGLRIAATTLVALSSLGVVVTTWNLWRVYGLISDALTGAGSALPRNFDAALEMTRITIWIHLALTIAAAVLLIIWLWKARRNAEAVSAVSHRRRRGWVIAGWFVPIVNLWFPAVIVNDVWRASNPATRGATADRQTVPLVNCWYACWIVGYILSELSDDVSFDAASLETLKSAVVLFTISTVLTVVAAVLLTVIMRKVSDWLRMPPPLATG